jgi:tetratricopeptide (TPR) repeat protein
MSEFELRFQRINQDVDFDVAVPVSVHFDTTDTEAFDFVNPLSDKDLAEIRWYLEQYYYWPSDIDRERARGIEGSLPKWGKALFDAVFGISTDAMRLFGRFDDDHAAGRVLTVDTTEPRILRLPWELLRDEGGYLFAKNPPMTVLRRMHQTRRTSISEFELPIRILMVTCRPDGAGFIDPRSIAAPLLDSLDAIPEQVEVEFLRPPTLRALDERLRDLNKPRVHIVHFDGHGVYDKKVGLGFLLFEDDKHEMQPVDAEQLGTLLNESGIPLMVLNACQSAKPDDQNPFASVASRLIESGVGAVVAMNYSVLVETAKRFTKEFYGALARGQSVNVAMDTARRNLFSDPKRFTFTRPNQEEAEILRLQDWFLPALYQQAETLTPFKPDGKSVSVSQRYVIPQQDKSERGGFPPPPLHGFKGRARELLDLERAFATRNIVVLHGFGGQGKTSLATQAAEWFTRTHLFERAAFISFETGASLDFVLNELGNAHVEENFQIHEGDKVEAIVQSLQEKPARVVFDNFESALPGGNAPMPAEELQKLLDAAATWSAPSDFRISNIGSRLLITTRNPNIPHAAFTPSQHCLHKELEGLAASDALELAASILEAYSLPRPPRVPLEELLAFLKGHPLSLQLALPQLRDYSAEQLVEQYQSILPQMKEGEAKERNESLEVSLRFSLDRLGADALNWLSRLWIFEGGAMENALLLITEIPEETWNALKPQLTSTALIRVEEIPGVNVPFIHFHPTLAPYLRTQFIALSGATEGSEVEARYRNIYYRFANQLYKEDTQHPMQARAIVLRELPNLKRALKRTLTASALDEAVTFAECINRFLDYFGRWRERDEITAEVERAVNSNQLSVVSDGKITKPQFVMETGRGERLLQQGRAGEAEKIFRALLLRLEGEADYDTRDDQAMILGYLGRCLRAKGNPSVAVDYYRRAIALEETLDQTENIRRDVATNHNDIADVLTAMGQYADAKNEYETALKFMREIHDDRSEGAILGQLGTLAMKQGDLNEARKRYLEVLEMRQRSGELQGQAIYWHQLGRVAQEVRDWDEAERCYKESIAIDEKIGDFQGAAQTCTTLGNVANSAGRQDEAERWHKKAIEYAEPLDDKQYLAMYYNNLANLYLSQNRLDEAEAYARRALAIKETLDLSSAPWTTYSILAQLAEKRGHKDEVREWRRKEQESFAAFAGSDNEIKQFEPLIAAIVQAANGDEEAKTYMEGIYPDMAAGGVEWAKGAEAVKRLVAGERDMSVLTEGLERTIALVVIRALQVLNGDNAQQTTDHPSPAVNGQSQPQQEGRVTLPQLLELVERAAKGDKELGGQLFTAFQQMARDEDKFQSALGNVLLRVLVGEREPNLDALPDEVGSAVRGLLGRLKNK